MKIGAKRVRLPRRVRGGVSAICCATLDGRGPMAAIGSGHGQVRVWDLAVGKPVGKSLQAHNGPIAAIELRPQGPHGIPVVVTAGEGDALRLWPLPSAEVAPERPLPSISLEHPITALRAVENRLNVGTQDRLSALAF